MVLAEVGSLAPFATQQPRLIPDYRPEPDSAPNEGNSPGNGQGSARPSCPPTTGSLLSPQRRLVQHFRPARRDQVAAFDLFIEVQVTAERQPFDRTMLNRLLDLAAGGIGGSPRLQSRALE